MQEFHNQTDITKKNAFTQTQFINWQTQAKAYKTYPKFYRRYNLDDYEELRFIKNFGKVTYSKKYGKDEVKLRVNPSAGGLYPCEIYIQIRGIKKFLNGIYHYEPLEDSLTLIHELSNDGLESYMNIKQQKFIFLLSNVYFRTSWKYEKRAIRYLLLDTGHQLGSIYASLVLEDMEHLFNFKFKKKQLNKAFSFDKYEHFVASIYSSEYKDIETNKLRDNIPFVPPCDYYIKEPFIEEFYSHSYHKSFDNLKINFLKELSKENLQSAINNRRSVRAFKQEAITKEEFETVLKDVFIIARKYNIEIFFINNLIIGLKKGIYKEFQLQEEGNFNDISTTLAFNQKIGGTSSVTIFFTSKIRTNYSLALILSGFLAHIISLRATNLQINSTGIGAYFDDEIQNTLITSNNILYLMAVGK
ncbi:SagB family peptide dehydrogenase [Arcobacter sp.]|uniref:SagB family peptide dehydrogenase n=1 Tax=unclassified Arcobacter TaxID=2593671 RepID=UPI003B000B05